MNEEKKLEITEKCEWELGIYVVCKTTYHTGNRLHGAWLDATMDESDIEHSINEMLLKSPLANEFRITEDIGNESFEKTFKSLEEAQSYRIANQNNHDVELSNITSNCETWQIVSVEGLPHCLIGEDDLDNVSEIAKGIEEFEEAFFLYADNHHCKGIDIRSFNDCYQGEYQNSADFAESLLKETGDLNEIPEHLRNYIDFESYGRDLEHDYDILEGNGCVYVFSN